MKRENDALIRWTGVVLSSFAHEFCETTNVTIDLKHYVVVYQALTSLPSSGSK